MKLLYLSLLSCSIGDFESIAVNEGHVNCVFKQPYAFTTDDNKVVYHNHKDEEHTNYKRISKDAFCYILNHLYMMSIILIISLGILLQPVLVITVTIGHIIMVLFCHWYFCVRH